MKISRAVSRALVASTIVALAAMATPSAARAAEGGDIVDDTTAVAPAEDGTGGAADVADESLAGSYRSGEEESGTTYPPKDEGGVVAPVCDAGSTWYRTTAYKHGRVTKWSRYSQNDYTTSSFTWTTDHSVTVTATGNVSGTIDANVAIKKIASVAFGTTTDVGLSGETASKYSYTRSVTFNRPGKWVLYRGHDSGSGTVTRYRCNGSETGSYSIGSAKPFTFRDGTVWGLLNCANSTTDRVAKNAKNYC